MIIIFFIAKGKIDLEKKRTVCVITINYTQEERERVRERDKISRQWRRLES